MVKRISVQQAQAEFDELIGRVHDTKEPVLVEKQGTVLAVVVSPEQYATSQRQGEEETEVKQTIDQRQVRVKPLTKEQAEQGLKALEEARAFSEELSARRGGRLFPDSAELIRQAREERDEHLAGL